MNVFLAKLLLASTLPIAVSCFHATQSLALPQRQRPSRLCAAAETGKPKRRRKKNKYANFSKVETKIKDPFEQMLEESERRKLEMEQEKVQKRKKKTERPTIPSLPKIEFPDNKDIDPYDPTSFGYIQVGTIVGAHGVHGWVKVKSSTDFPIDRLCKPGIRHIKAPRKRAPRKVILLEGKHRLEEEYLVRLESVYNRDEAIKLRGSIIYAREEEEVNHSAEEYLVQDLVGLEVYLDEEEQQIFVGTIAGVVLGEEMCAVPGIGHDMLEVTLPRGAGGMPSLRDEMVLIPFVPEIVPRVDLSDNAVFIEPPPGLLDLTYVKEERIIIKGLLPPAN